MNSAERRAVAGLWSLQGIGRKTLDKLSLLGPFEQWLTTPTQKLVARREIPTPAKAGLLEVRTLAHAADVLEKKVAGFGYEIVFVGDPKYPERLAETPFAPPMLFVLGPGAAVPPRRRVAMVGTRRPDTGFLERARAFAFDIAAAGVGVVSGGAVGIDQACHGAALRAGQETWAFLGCAIEEIDPPQQVLLEPFQSHGGTLFSDFPPGARPSERTFPRRNRLIAGASDATLMLRGDMTSGALYTARRAVQCGRPLLAMPGDFFNASAMGCNDLIRRGHARICVHPDDVFDAVGVKARAGERVTHTDVPLLVSPLAERVAAHLGRTPVDFDVLLGKTKIDSGALASVLLELELANRVVQRAGRRYEKT